MQLERYFFESVRFRYYTVRIFNPSSSFTSVSPLLDKPVVQKVNGKYKEMGWYFSRIFDTSTMDKFTGAVTDICKSTKMQRQQTEADTVIQLIMKVMLPLFGEATVEKNKRYIRSDDSLTKISGLDMKFIGMGNSMTWHGSPDFRIGYVCVLCDVEEGDPYAFEPEPSTISESYIPHSLSSPTNFEAKLQIENVDRDQLTAACVVSSFINHKVHKKSMTPAVLINGENFIISVYDCVQDILLISDPIKYVSYDKDKGTLDRFGLVALAIAIHYKTTMLPIPCTNSLYKSGILDKLQEFGCLQHFQSLDDMGVDVSRLKMCNSTMITLEADFLSPDDLVPKGEEGNRKRTQDNVQESQTKKSRN